MKKLKIYFIIFMTVMFTGCEEFLDKTDPTATSFVEFFNTEEDLRRVVYSSYYDVFSHPTVHQTLFYMQDGKSDNAYSRVEGHYHQRVANGNINSNTAGFLYYYELQMKHLGRLNTFIANADVPYVEDESKRTKYKSIMEGMRIWHYFKLTSQWGDVPFFLEPADLSSATQPATPRDEILNTIFPMGEEIASRLPIDEYTSDKYMFNQNSLKAVIMRYALYYERYDVATRLAQEIIDSGKYELYPNYGDLFQYKASSSNDEFIMHFDMPSHGNSATHSFRDLGPHYRTSNGESYVVPLKSLVDAYWTLQGRRIDNCPLHTKEEYELNPNLNRDPRYSASIMGQGDDFYGEPIDIYNSNNPMFFENQRASKSGYWFKKFVDETDAFRGSGNMDFPLLRYAEVLLSYAEAKIMSNDINDVAKSYINQVRERAGLDMGVADVTLPAYDAYTQEDWIQLIRNERRTEFAAEGLRYDDIIRWRIADEVLNQPALGHTRKIGGQLVSLKIEDRSFLPHNYLWPFHENSLKVEPGLSQNPGY